MRRTETEQVVEERGKTQQASEEVVVFGFARKSAS